MGREGVESRRRSWQLSFKGLDNGDIVEKKRLENVGGQYGG